MRGLRAVLIDSRGKFRFQGWILMFLSLRLGMLILIL